MENKSVNSEGLKSREEKISEKLLTILKEEKVTFAEADYILRKVSRSIKDSARLGD